MGAGALGLITMQNEFSTARMRTIFDDKNRLDKMCQVERAFAKVQGELGIIPKEASDCIQKTVRVKNIAIRELYLESAKAGHFTSGFVTYFSKRLGEEAGQYIHYGLTTQDVLDTATVLILRDAHRVILDNMESLLREQIKQVRKYRQTIIVGHAHGQVAAPTTLGYQLAIVLDELGRYYKELHEIASFVFTGAFAGVVGTYASFGPQAQSIVEKACQQLDLSVPTLCWHTQRDRFIDYAHILAKFSGALGKLGQDLFDASRSEIGEFEEGYVSGRQGSTTIPTIRPPYLCEILINLNQLICQEMPLIYQSSRITGEKDTIAWRNQWVALPNICLYLSGQVNAARALIRYGRWKRTQIAKNVQQKKTEIMSEALMFALGRKIGKQRAHALLYEVMNHAQNRGLSLHEELIHNQRILSIVSIKELEETLKPSTYIGLATKKADQVVKNISDLITYFSERRD